MPAAITEFVDVTVNVASGPADKFGFNSLLGVFNHSVTANRQDGPYVNIAEVVAAGFTAAAEPEVNAWATAVFAQANGVDSIIIGREDAIDANWTATMDAVEAADPDSFYFINIESRVQADIEEVAAWTQARFYLYIAQSADAAILAGTPANVALNLQASSYTRTALIYHATSTGTDGYLDGAWSSFGGGFNLDTPDGVGTWFGNQLLGVTFDAVTSAEATEIYDAGANLFGRNAGLQFTSKGTTAEGRFIDVTTSTDWYKKRLEEALITTLVTTPTKIPYTNDGISKFTAASMGVLLQGVSFGHGSPDDPPTVSFPDSSEVSSADKQARQLTGTSTTTLAGAIHKVVFTLNAAI
jgi:hypothetical protein